MALTEEEKQKNLEICFESTFAGEVGEKVLQDLERECGWNHVLFEKDARFEAFLLGRRSIYRYILDMIESKVSSGKVERPESYINNGKEKNNG